MADASPSRTALHQLLDQLPEDQIAAAHAALTQVQQDALYSALASIPGVRLPAHWPPRFAAVDPVPYEGEEPPSEQLIRERR